MTCIIVTGCFRSGTSAVAGVLHHLGVFMGDQFDEPNPNNPKGFWEDVKIKELHNLYEEGLGNDVVYQEYIDKRNSEHKIWGVKDPMFCKYLGKFTSMCPDTRLIVCRRPVEEIAVSMGNAVGVDHKMFIKIAEHYVETLNQSVATYTGPILEVHKKDPMIDILEPICEFIGLPSNQQAIDFLS